MSVSAICRLICREVPRVATWKRLGSIRRICITLEQIRRARGPECQHFVRNAARRGARDHDLAWILSQGGANYTSPTTLSTLACYVVNPCTRGFWLIRPFTRRVTVSGILAAIAFGLASPLSAQDACAARDGPNASVLCVSLRLDNGRLATERTRT